LRDLDPAEVARAAEAALSEAAGEAVAIGDVETLSGQERRNLILRGRLSGDGRSVIVKATRAGDYDATAANAFEAFGLVKEWAATALLAVRAPAGRHGARLLAGDAARGILVFEDIGAGSGSLVEPLRDGGPEAAERALIAYAVALGRLHADTVACSDEHAKALRAGFPAARLPVPRQRARLERLAAAIRERVGGYVPDDDLAQIAHRLQEPGAWLALVHGDPCPDNALLAPDGLRLIDFEFAMPGHALQDAVYWRIGFPTCWCAGRVPDAVAARVEAAYRAEAGRVIVAARDAVVFRRESAFIAAAWLLTSLDWRLDSALAEDGMWGIASMRSRLLWYLEATIAMTEDADILPGLRSAARDWLGALRARWPASESLGLYPAFTRAG
jgi:Ser/Thr protein kinase RdoA (MazF antagonist)